MEQKKSDKDIPHTEQEEHPCPSCGGTGFVDSYPEDGLYETVCLKCKGTGKK